MTARLVLIGPMGAGKTRIGKRAARLLGARLRDTDKMVVAEHGPIAAIFDEHGEAHFRELEHQAVARALGEADIVALGGGAVLDPRTRALLADQPVLLLTVSAESVAPRIGGGKRPLLREGGIEAWSRILEQRLPVYTEIAHHSIDTSHRADDELAREVADWVLAREARPETPEVSA